MKKHIVAFVLLLTYNFFSAMVSADTADSLFFYTIKPGDSIWAISQTMLESPARWSDIQTLNGIPNAKALAVGKVIKIPYKWLKKWAFNAEISHVQGSVEIVRKNRSRHPAKKGQKIFAGDRILTTADGLCTLLFADKSQLRLQENTEILVENIVIQQKHKNPIGVKILQSTGSSEVDVNPETHKYSPFEVSTPISLTSVRGTQFRVVLDSSSSQVKNEVLTGNVKLENPQASVLLPANTGSIAKVGEAPSQPRKLPTAPVITSDKTQSKPFKISWQNAPNLQYVVELFDLDEYRIGQFLTIEKQLTIDTLDTGDYRLSIRAIDKQGFNSRSVEQLITVTEPLVKRSISPYVWRYPKGMHIQWQDTNHMAEYKLTLHSPLTNFIDKVVEGYGSSIWIPEPIPAPLYIGIQREDSVQTYWFKVN